MNIQRPLADRRPLGPFAQLESTTSSDEQIFMELIFDKDKFASEAKPFASNIHLKEGLENKRDSPISNVGLNLVIDVLEETIDASNDTLDNLFLPVEDNMGREIVKPMSDEVSVMIHNSDLSPIEINRIISEFEDRGLDVKNKGGFTV